MIHLWLWEAVRTVSSVDELCCLMRTPFVSSFCTSHISPLSLKWTCPLWIRDKGTSVYLAMDVPGRRPSPYSLQPLEPPARSNSPELKSVPPRERLSPPIGESSQFISGSGARGYALPRDASSVQPPQQNSAMSYTPAASRYELEIRKKVPESPYTSQLNAIGNRDPPPYSERFSNDGPVGHDVVELHEADQFFGFSQPPQAIQSMVKMVTMLNFMKVCSSSMYCW